jgi:hypothetical protein
LKIKKKTILLSDLNTLYKMITSLLYISFKTENNHRSDEKEVKIFNQTIKLLQLGLNQSKLDRFFLIIINIKNKSKLKL